MNQSLLACAIVLLLSSSSAMAWEPMCGFADEVQNFIRENNHEKIATKVLVEGRQGENGRLIEVFESGTWLVTFEFFSDGPVETDVSCLVDSGKSGDESAVQYVTRLIDKLPEARFKDFGKNPKDFEPMKRFIPASR